MARNFRLKSVKIFTVIAILLTLYGCAVPKDLRFAFGEGNRTLVINSYEKNIIFPDKKEQRFCLNGLDVDQMHNTDLDRSVAHQGISFEKLGYEYGKGYCTNSVIFRDSGNGIYRFKNLKIDRHKSGIYFVSASYVDGGEGVTGPIRIPPPE